MLRIAILGGTFDPIHNGHLKTSLIINKHFNFNSFIFLPCKTPTLKAPPLASNAQRIEMIKLAIQDHCHFKLDLREIDRDTPSYMVDTLKSFRREFPKASITLIIGYDAFLSLPYWHQWQKIITLAHLVVINRSEFAKVPVPEIMHEFLNSYQKSDRSLVSQTQGGCVYLFDAGTYEISSSSIRRDLNKGLDVTNKIPHLVYEYIKSQGLYQ